MIRCAITAECIKARQPHTCCDVALALVGLTSLNGDDSIELDSISIAVQLPVFVTVQAINTVLTQTCMSIALSS